MKITIRPAEKSDFDEWVKMRSELWPSTKEEAHLNELQSLIEDKKFFGYMAVYEKKIIAFMEVYLRPFANGCNDQPIVFLEGVWVHKAWRRKKVAQKLIGHLEEWAKENGHTEIASDSALSNENAHLAHKSWGFKETSRVICFKKNLS